MSKNRFVIEVQGVTACTASKVSGLDAVEHTPSELMVGNRGNPILGPGNQKHGEVTVTHAEGLGQAGAELFELIRAYVKREKVEPFDARVMLMSQDGATPIKSYECLGCVPTKFKGDDLDATSSDEAMFSFSF